jgi:hypothetical protein
MVVEVEVPRPADLTLSKEMKESLATLAQHPAFVYLLRRLRMQRHNLEAQLRDGRHENLRDVEFIQSGIFWTSWLQGQIDTLVGRTAPIPTAASPSEIEAFEAVHQHIDLVGS